MTADRDGDPAQPGYYLFENLSPGCYVVEFTKPAGFVFTDKNVLGPPSVANDSDADAGRAGPSRSSSNRVSNTGYSISVTFSNGDVVSITVP